MTSFFGCFVLQNGQINGSLNKHRLLLEFQWKLCYYLLDTPFEMQYLQRRVPQHNNCHGWRSMKEQYSQTNFEFISFMFPAFKPPEFFLVASGSEVAIDN